MAGGYPMVIYGIGIYNLVGGWALPLWKLMEFVSEWKNNPNVRNHQAKTMEPPIFHRQNINKSDITMDI